MEKQIIIIQNMLFEVGSLLSDDTMFVQLKNYCQFWMTLIITDTVSKHKHSIAIIVLQWYIGFEHQK